MATVKCIYKKGRGRTTHEWNDGVKDRIYCHGWMDSMTDELVPECRDCADHVNKAQEDGDAWNRRAKK